MSEETNVEMQETPTMNFVARFIGVITSPVATFADIVKSPTWLLPLLAAIIVTVGITFQMVPMIAKMTAEEMAKNPNMTQDQIEQAVGIVKMVTPYMPILYITIWNLILGLLMMLVGGLFMGGSSSYKTLFSVACWAGPIMIVTGIIAMIFRIFTRTIESPTSLIFMAPDAERDSAIYFLLTQIDLLAIWYIAVIGIGFAAAYKFATQKGIITTFVSWAVIILAIAGIKAAF